MQKTVTLFLFIAALITGCAYENEDEKYRLEPGCDDVIPEYETDVEPIMDQYCVTCHGSNMAQNGIRLDSDTAVIAVAESGLLKEVLLLPSGDSRKMPQGRDLPPCDLELLIEWINNLNN